MANEKIIKTRIQMKNDTQANWEANGTNFIPLRGEIIIYSADATHSYSRLKIGDGTTTLPVLPFIDAGTINGEVLADVIVTAENANFFPQQGHTNKLYIDLNTNTVYCYSPQGAYTQLSHFKYQATKTNISTVTNWDPGRMTEASVEDINLIIENGIIPTLELNTVEVVTSISEVSA